MTSQLPDDMFIENSRIAEQLAAGNASPQPGITVDADPPPRTRNPKGGAAVASAVIGAALVAIAGLAGFWFISSSDGAGVAEEPVASAPASADEPYPISDIAATTYDNYLAMADDESIFSIIPRTDEGWDYFRAFMFKIADYKVAESIGGRLTYAQVAEMRLLESRFLALEDLDMTVDITLSDGTHFVHDGHPPTLEGDAPSSP